MTPRAGQRSWACVRIASAAPHAENSAGRRSLEQRTAGTSSLCSRDVFARICGRHVPEPSLFASESPDSASTATPLRGAPASAHSPDVSRETHCQTPSGSIGAALTCVLVRDDDGHSARTSVHRSHTRPVAPGMGLELRSIGGGGERVNVVRSRRLWCVTNRFWLPLRKRAPRRGSSANPNRYEDARHVTSASASAAVDTCGGGRHLDDVARNTPMGRRRWVHALRDRCKHVRPEMGGVAHNYRERRQALVGLAIQGCSPHTRPLSLPCTRSAGLQDVSRETSGPTTAEPVCFERAARPVELNRCSPHAESGARSEEEPIFGSGEADYVL